MSKIYPDRRTYRKLKDVTKEYEKRATPGQGKLIHEEGTETDDRKTSEILFQTYGGDIKTLKVEKENGRDVKTPDALWDGMYWEYKKVSNKSSINDRMKEAWKKQREFSIRKNIENNPIGLVFDISNKKQSVEETIHMISEEIIKRIWYPADVIIKDGNEIIVVLRKHKKK